MKRLVLAPFFLLPFVAACGGWGGSTGTPLQQSAAAPSSALSQAQTVSEAQSDALQQPQAAFVPASSDLLYVGNIGTNSITVYRTNQQGNTAPMRVIAGSRTGINAPGQLSEDAAGNLYVANGSLDLKSTNPAILVFAHGANGNVAPIRKLAGPLTGIVNAESMTVDQKTGKIFVFEDSDGNQFPAPFVLRFPPDANGNTAPFARGSAAYPALELASDSTGNNLIEAHSASAPSVSTIGIQTLVKQFANGLAPTLLYRITDMYAAGIADDPATKTYLVTSNNAIYGTSGIYRMAETTQGDGPLAAPFPVSLTPAPISVITSDTCGSQLALGYLRSIYVTHSKTNGACPTDAVYVYAYNAAGNAAPLRILTGAATRLSQPYGIYEGR